MKHIIKTALLQVGMTEREVRAMELTVNTANAMFDLPKLHPADHQEICTAIHVLQEKLMSRPAMREMQSAEKK